MERVGNLGGATPDQFKEKGIGGVTDMLQMEMMKEHLAQGGHDWEFVSFK